MKRTSRIFLFLGFPYVFVLSLAAQPNQPGAAWAAKTASSPSSPASVAPITNSPYTGKVALIDSRAFYDEKIGVQKLIAAYQQLEKEFLPRHNELKGLQTRVSAIAEEINRTDGKISSEAMMAKREEGEKLQREYEFKRNEAKAAYGRREKDLITPLFAHLGKAMEEFMTARGIAMILDTAKMGDALLAVMPSTDLTKEFIEEYNAKNPASVSAAQR